MIQCRHSRRSTFSAFTNRASAFTLIELLVVIAIIAILAAILFPVFAQAREKARQTSCLSNTKQLGLAVYQYLQDFDELMPNGTYQYGAIGGWAGQVQPYTKNAGVFRCASDVVDTGSQWKPSSYGMNNNFSITGGVQNGVLNNQSYGLPDMVAPAKTVLLYEVEGSNNIDITQYKEGPYTINYNGSPFGNGRVDRFSPSGGGTFDACPPNTANGETLKYATGYMGNRSPGAFACHFTAPDGRHSGGSNFLMADTHAKWFKGTQVSSGGSASTETGNQNDSQYGQAAGTSGNLSSGTPVGATFSLK
jgi:prepilin-type N-terminal cleavage/methylation domain-containing protein/prepilin-type processing-associated H-X9-DG protein